MIEICAVVDRVSEKMSGFEVLERIRSDERTSRLPVVILTSSAEEQACVESYIHGAILESLAALRECVGERCRAVEDGP